MSGDKHIFLMKQKNQDFNQFAQRGKQLRDLRRKAVVASFAKFSRRVKVGHWTIVKFELNVQSQGTI